MASILGNVTQEELEQFATVGNPEGWYPESHKKNRSFMWWLERELELYGTAPEHGESAIKFMESCGDAFLNGDDSAIYLGIPELNPDFWEDVREAFPPFELV